MYVCMYVCVCEGMNRKREERRGRGEEEGGGGL
jgi:hypothetical protein